MRYAYVHKHATCKTPCHTQFTVSYWLDEVNRSIACCLTLSRLTFCERCLQFHSQHWAVMMVRAHRRVASLPSCLELNCLRSTARAKWHVIDLLAKCCLLLGHPWAANGAAQLCTNITIKAASLKIKLVWKRNYDEFRCKISYVPSYNSKDYCYYCCCVQSLID